jgi:hypothetical protein
MVIRMQPGRQLHIAAGLPWDFERETWQMLTCRFSDEILFACHVNQEDDEQG